MSVIYNLGIGLVAVDRASPAINSVDASLVTLRSSTKAAAEDALPSLQTAFRSATGAAHEMHMVLTGRSLDDDILRVTNLWGVFTGLVKNTVGWLGDAAAQIESLSFLGDLADPVLDFEDSTQKMAMGLGRTSEAAAQARQDIMGLVGSTQFAIGEFIQLDQGLSQVGKTVGDFSEETGSRMVELNQIFGVAGEDIGRMTVLTEQFGGSLGQTLDDATMFQKSFGLPGIFKELPGIVDFARESLIKYGAEVTGGSRSIMRNTQQMAGVYAKAFGKTISQAVSSAQETLGRFMGASRNFRRVFLGLESDFDPLTQAFQEANIPLMDTQKLLQSAQTDVVGFATQTRKIIGGLDPWKRSRFVEQLRDELPADMLALITDTEAYNAAVRNQSEAARRQAMLSAEGSAKFKDLSAGMLDTTKEMKAMWLNMKQLIKVTLVETGLVDVMRKVFERARDRLVDFNEGMQAFVQSDRFQGWVKTVQPFLISLGEKILVAGTAINEFGAKIGGVLGSLFGVGGFIGSVRAVEGVTGRTVPVLSRMADALAKVGGFFKMVAGRAFGAFKKFFPVFNIVSSLKTAIVDMGEVLGDPNATGVEKFAAFMRGTFKGVGTFVNNLLLGIPGMVIKSFFPDLERQFDVGFANLFNRVSTFDLTAAMGKAWTNLTDWLAIKITNLDVWLAKKLPDFSKAAQGLGRAIGGAIGGITAFLGPLLVDAAEFLAMKLFNPVYWATSIGQWARDVFGPSSEGTKKIKDEASSGIGGAMLGVLTSVTQVVVDGLQGVIDGFLGAWGTSLEEVVLKSKLSWAIIYNSTAEVLTGLSTGFKNFVDMAIGFTGDIVIGFLAGLAKIPGGAKKIWTRLGNMLSSVTNTLIIEPINKLVTGAQQAFGTLLSNLIKPIKDAFDKLPAAIRDNIPGISDLSAALTNVSSAADTLKNSAVDVIDPLKVLSDSQIANRMKAIDKETNKTLAGFGNMSQALQTIVADRQKARTAAKTQADEERRMDETMLAQGLQTLKKAREQRQLRSTEARKFRDAQRAGYDALFAQMRRDAGSSMGERQLDAAQRSLTSILDESLRSITGKVREGQISAADAQAAFDKSAADAIKKVIQDGRNEQNRANRERSRMRAGAAAQRATGAGAGAGGGMDPVLWAQLVKAVETSAREQNIRVSFPKSGRGIEGVLNRTARVSHQTRGGTG